MTPTKPDFSGEWILNRKASTLGPGADSAESALWTIDHREPVFHHTASFVMDGGTREYQYELRSDDVEVVSDADGVRNSGRLRWEGDALVVCFHTVHPAGEMTISFRYELIDGGRRLRAAEQLRGTDHDQENIWIFDRR